MHGIIIYTTSHGCTEKCALKIKENLDGEIELVNLKKSKIPSLENYDTIIVGGSIHAGQIQKKIKKFCQDNLDLLKSKKLGLFLCCMEEGENATKQFDNAYPEVLRKHASATGLLGGEFNFEKMNFLQKAIIKKIAKVEESVSKLSGENLMKFVRDMKNG